MGYNTDFSGQFNLNKPLDDETFTFLKKFNETRRMKRDLTKLGMTQEEAATYGVEGEFYVSGGGFAGQDRDDSILNYNSPPSTQPTLWCQWIPTEDSLAIEWDQGEKFYESAEWIKYLIDNVLAPKGYILNGIVEAQGEDSDDRWDIVIVDNQVFKQFYDLVAAQKIEVN